MVGENFKKRWPKSRGGERWRKWKQRGGGVELRDPGKGKGEEVREYCKQRKKKKQK